MNAKVRIKRLTALVLSVSLLVSGVTVWANPAADDEKEGGLEAGGYAALSENQLSGYLEELEEGDTDESRQEEKSGEPESENTEEIGEDAVEEETVSQNEAGASMEELVEVKSPFEEDRYNPDYYGAVSDRYPAKEQGGSLFAVGRAVSFEDYILNAIDNFEMYVDVTAYNIPLEDMWTEIYHVLNNHPDLFYVTVTSAYHNPYTGMVAGYILTYIGTKDTIEVEKARFQAEADKAVAYVDNTMSQYEKALAIHDYIILNCEYDEENFDADTVPGESHSAYGALVKKIAVCDGYAKAYQYIMSQKLGIPCQVVTSDTMGHAWSLIKIDGSWYHADLTWDDPVYDCIGRVYHSFFLLSDSEMSDWEHEHYDWKVEDENRRDIKAVSDYYSDWKWTSIYSGMFHKNGNWYYVKPNGDGILRDNDLSTSSEELLYAVDDEGNPAWQVSGCLARIMLYQNRIYFNTPSVIKSINLNGGGEKIEQEVVKASDQFIYGFVIQSGNMKYALRRNTGEAQMQEVCTFGVPAASIAGVVAKDYNSLDITLNKVERSAEASASGYVIYRKASWEKNWQTAALLEGADNLYFRDGGLGDDLQYIYMARNYQVINGDICYGPSSSQVSATTMKARPVVNPQPAKDTAVKGKTYQCGNYKYKVTTVANGKTGKVTLMAPTKKTLTKVTIPATVSINNETYKVTAVEKNAFKNNQKLKSVTIGKNVTKIGANAFYGCKKLKTISIKSTTLKSVGKGAFKGIVKNATIKVPKSKLTAYKKLLKKKAVGLPSKAKLKKA
ncbi:MAG: leucine-rich repeat protein [Roseburia sp.]|nr:leucine-rich repeat protein [Roseburia sp.]MCM1277469.1 leucine-rich repeat protein [Robinsoniella sp.]